MHTIERAIPVAKKFTLADTRQKRTATGVGEAEHAQIAERTHMATHIAKLHILIIITKRVYAVMSNIPVGTLQKHMAMEVGGVGHARIAGRIHMLGKPALRPELVHVVQ